MFYLNFLKFSELYCSLKHKTGSISYKTEKNYLGYKYLYLHYLQIICYGLKLKCSKRYVCVCTDEENRVLKNL